MYMCESMYVDGYMHKRYILYYLVKKAKINILVFFDKFKNLKYLRHIGLIRK